jgi:hypothetical protein
MRRNFTYDGPDKWDKNNDHESQFWKSVKPNAKLQKTQNKLQNRKIAKPKAKPIGKSQKRQNAESQNRKIAKTQNRNIAKTQNRQRKTIFLFQFLRPVPRTCSE